MILIFIILLIIIFIVIFLLKKKKERFSSFNKRQILGNVSDDNFHNSINNGNLDIIVGTPKSRTFLTSDSNYFFRGNFIARFDFENLNEDDDDDVKTTFDEKYNMIMPSKYLNTPSNKCNVKKNDECFKEENGKVYQTILYNKPHANTSTNTGLWNFQPNDNNPDKKLYYGQTINIRSVSNKSGFLCICEEFKNVNDTINSCGDNVGVFLFNNKDKIKEYGEWIILPKFVSIFNGTNKEIFTKNCGGQEISSGENISTDTSSKNSDMCASLKPTPFLEIGRPIEYDIISYPKKLNSYKNKIDGFKLPLKLKYVDKKPFRIGTDKPENKIAAVFNIDKNEITSKDYSFENWGLKYTNTGYMVGDLLIPKNTGEFEGLVFRVKSIKIDERLKFKYLSERFKKLLKKYGYSEEKLVRDTEISNEDKYMVWCFVNGLEENNVCLSTKILKDLDFTCAFINDRFTISNMKPGMTKKEHLESVLDKIKIYDKMVHKTDIIEPFESDDDEDDEDVSNIFMKKPELSELGENQDADESEFINNLYNKKIPIKVGKQLLTNLKDKYYVEETDNEDDYQKTETQTNDVFYIINRKRIDGKYIILSMCDDESFKTECKEEKSAAKSTEENQQDRFTMKPYYSPVGILSSYIDFSYKMFDDKNLRYEFTKDGVNKIKEEMPNYSNIYLSDYYCWNLTELNYNVNVAGTLFVKDKIKIGNSFIDANILKKIKKIPYLFKDELCLKNSEGNTTCMRSEHIEMLRGERNLTINAFIRLKPFTLYSKINYEGRELKIGFDYINAKNLPIIPLDESNKPHPNGLWRSIKVERPYKIIIYDSPLQKEPELNNTCSSGPACSKIKPFKRELVDQEDESAPEITKLGVIENSKKEFDECKKECDTKNECTFVNEKNEQGRPEAGTCIPKKSNEVMVILYEHPNYKGDAAPLSRLGNYNLADLEIKGYTNNTLSHMIVYKGYKVILYEHNNFRGRSRVFYSGDYAGGRDMGFFADRMTSLKIEKDYTIKRRVIDNNLSNISNSADKKNVNTELKWTWGIRAVSFPYHFNSYGTNSVQMIENPIKQKCMTQKDDFFLSKNDEEPETKIIFKGCFVDHKERQYPDGKGRINKDNGLNYILEECANKCKGYSYFALQSGNHSPGPECWCGNDFNSDTTKYKLVDNSECTLNVNGTDMLIGDDWRNAVYGFDVQQPDLIKDNVFTAEECDNQSLQKFQIKSDPNHTNNIEISDGYENEDNNEFSDVDHVHFHKHKLNTIHDDSDEMINNDQD